MVTADARGGRALGHRPVGGMGQLAPAGVHRGGSQTGGDHATLPLLQIADGGGVGTVRHRTQPDLASRERAGLVEAQHVHPPERLDGPRVAHQCPAAGQPPGRGQLRGRGEKGQALGHRGDS